MAGAMMAYSTSDRRFVLFGGWDGVSALNETWNFDSENRTWNKIHPLVSPAARGDGMFVYDESTDAFVLFGGWQEVSSGTHLRLSDTWIFSLRTNSWIERHPVASPSPRSDAEVAYGLLGRAILLVGGFNGSAYLGDIWSYSVATNTWVQRFPAVKPSPRADGRMVYVPSQDRFILFGGNDYNGANFTFHHLADTWAYNWTANTWRHVPTSVSPSARDYPLLWADPRSSVVLLTSGYGNRTILNDLWAFDLTTDMWSNITPTFSPPPRYAGTGGFDSAGNAFVLFGGAGTNGLLADTWYYRHDSTNGPADPFPLIAEITMAAAGIGLLGVGVRIAVARKDRRTHDPDSSIDAGRKS